MTNSYEWQFNPIEVSAADVDGLEDCIKNIHWRITAVSDDETPLSATGYGVVALNSPDPDPDQFIPFNLVTRDQIKTWVIEKLSEEKGVDIDEAGLKSMLSEQIEEQQAPKVLSKIPAGWGD